MHSMVQSTRQRKVSQYQSDTDDLIVGSAVISAGIDVDEVAV
jgi:superfamily II DNA/RNA helicase